MFIIPNIIRVFLTFFGSVLGDFPAEYSCDRFVFVYFPEYIRVLLYFYVYYLRLPLNSRAAPFLQTCKSWNFEAPPLFLCSLSQILFGAFLHFSVQYSAISPPSDQPSLLLCALRCPWYHLRYWVFDEWYSDSFSMFIIPDVIRGLSHILQFSARGFPREFPYLYKKKKKTGA